MGEEIDLIEGPSGLTLGWSSMKYLWAAVACVVPLAFSHNFPAAWAITWVTLSIGLATGYLVLSLRSQRAWKTEAAHGYSTALHQVRLNRKLAFVDGRDGSIVSLPGEPLPASGRNADIDATRIANGHPKRSPAPGVGPHGPGR